MLRVTLIVLLCTTAADAQYLKWGPRKVPPVQAERANKLVVGNRAPQLSAERMIQGQLPDTDQDYLVVYFAEWCRPCNQAVPKLNEWYEMGVQVVGVTSQDTYWNSRFDAKVRNFIQRNEASYPVAVADRSFRKNWVDASGNSSIPLYIMIRNGRVTMIGNELIEYQQRSNQ